MAFPFLHPDLLMEAIDARRSLLARARHSRASRRLAKIDLAGMRLVRRTARSRRATRAIVTFSRAGEHGALWLAVGTTGARVDRRRRSQWICGVGAVGASYVANTTIKQVARRPRPQLRDLPPLVRTPTQLSFPSSHAASSFAAAAAYRDLLPTGPLYATAAAMAISRVHLGVHYPSDIAIGAVLGTTIGTTARLTGRRLQQRTERRAREARAAEAPTVADAPAGPAVPAAPAPAAG